MLIHPSFLSLGYSWLFDFLLFSVSHLHAFHSVYRLSHLERVREQRMRGPLPHCPRLRNHNFKPRDLARPSPEPCQLLRCRDSLQHCNVAAETVQPTFYRWFTSVWDASCLNSSSCFWLSSASSLAMSSVSCFLFFLSFLGTAFFILWISAGNKTQG